MNYSFNSRVRYSETGENGKLTLPGVLNYFQDCTTFHSEAVGRGMETLEQMRKVWGIGRVADLRRPVSRTGRKNYSLYLAL